MCIDGITEIIADQCTVCNFSIAIRYVNITVLQYVDRPGIRATNPPFELSLLPYQAVYIGAKRHVLRRDHPSNHYRIGTQDLPVTFVLILEALVP